MSDFRKAVVIGLDGLSPQLLSVLIDKNVFSAIGKIMENGAYSQLQSTFPPVTAPAWTTFATGVNPGKHGIFNFVFPEKSLSDITPVSANNIAVKTFYELLEAHQRKSVIINLPVSWPPLTKNPTITSLLTQGDSPVYPRSLLEQIPILKKYQIMPKESSEGKPYIYDPKFVNQVRRVENLRFKSSMELLKLDWDFFFVLFSGTDWLSHHVYNRLIDGSAEDEVWQFFKEIDSYVEKIFDFVKDEADIFIISDHGFQVIEKQFAINQWLNDQGLLKRAKTAGPKSGKGNKELNLASLSWLLNFGWLSRVAFWCYEKLKKYLPIPVVVRESLDITRTSAFSTGWGVYINSDDRFVDGSVPASKREPLAKEIKAKLSKLRDPKTGEKVFEDVFLREEIYSGGERKKAPDIILIPNKSWQVTAMLSVRQVFSYYKRNDHAQKGIFIANGKNIIKGYQLNSLSRLEDVPATVLYVLGEPLPKYLDGRVIREIFKD